MAMAMGGAVHIHNPVAELKGMNLTLHSERLSIHGRTVYLYAGQQLYAQSITNQHPPFVKASEASLAWRFGPST